MTDAATDEQIHKWLRLPLAAAERSSDEVIQEKIDELTLSIETANWLVRKRKVHKEQLEKILADRHKTDEQRIETPGTQCSFRQ